MHRNRLELAPNSFLYAGCLRLMSLEKKKAVGALLSIVADRDCPTFHNVYAKKALDRSNGKEDFAYRD
jgi:hypothetical protein